MTVGLINLQFFSELWYQKCALIISISVLTSPKLSIIKLRFFVQVFALQL